MSNFDGSSAPATVVAEGLYRFDTPLGERIASLYLVVGDMQALLFDTGVNGTIPAHILPALTDLGLDARDVRSVVVSHCDVDHFGGVADARAAFSNARILAHAADRPAIEDFGTYLAQRGRGFLEEFGLDEDPAVLQWARSAARTGPLDANAHDAQVIDLGGREVIIRHVPGHSRGHLAIEVPSADAILVSDAVLGASVDLADGTPAFPPTYRFIDDYLATITRLRAAGHRLLLTAHYPTFSGAETAGFLDESEAFANRLDGLVLSCLRSHPEGVTLAELLDEINPTAGRWPTEGTAGALAFPVAGHLERYLERGVVRKAGAKDGTSMWAPA